MRTAICFCVFICLLTTAFSGAEAAVYKYKDQSGRTVFVDEESRIPSQYRGAANQVKTAPAPVAAQPVEEASETGGTAATENTGGEKPAEALEPPARTITDKGLEQRARQEAASLDRARAYQTPVMVRGSRVLVPVEVISGGKSAHLMMLLDDKAQLTTIHRPAVQELRFSPGEQLSLQGSGSRAVKAEKVLAGTIDIGPFELKDFPVALITPQGGAASFDGTLGQDFLKDHPYTVDFAREMLRWQQPGK